MILPMRLRSVPSGLMMLRVRSMAMVASICEEFVPWWGENVKKQYARGMRGRTLLSENGQRSELEVEERLHAVAHFCGGLTDGDASRGERSVLLSSRAFPTGDDGAGVAHALPWRCGCTCDEANNGLGEVAFGADRLCGLDFEVATDFADEDHAIGVGVGFEHLEDFNEARAVDRVAADADTGRLANAECGELTDGFVGERTGLGDDTDAAFQVDVAGHDADLACAGRDDAGAVRANEAAVGAFEVFLDLDHVEDGNAFGDADDQFDASFGRFHDGVGSERRRNEDHGCVCAGCGARFRDGVEDGDVDFKEGTALSGGHAANELGAVCAALRRVEGACRASDALTDKLGIFINENRHDASSV